MKNSMHSEIDASGVNIVLESSITSSAIRTKAFEELSMKNSQIDQRLRRLSNSGGNKFTQNAHVKITEGISWQISKELNMTIEERNACEKKAHTFESRLFGLMKDIENKYKQKEPQQPDSKNALCQNPTVTPVKKHQQTANKDSLEDKQGQGVDTYSMPSSRKLEGSHLDASNLKTKLEQLKQIMQKSDPDHKAKASINSEHQIKVELEVQKFQAGNVTPEQISTPKVIKHFVPISSKKQSNLVPLLEFQRKQITDSGKIKLLDNTVSSKKIDSDSKQSHRQSRDHKLQRIRERLGNINSLKSNSVSMQQRSEREDLVDYELSEGDTSFHNKPSRRTGRFTTEDKKSCEESACWDLNSEAEKITIANSKSIEKSHNLLNFDPKMASNYNSSLSNLHTKHIDVASYSISPRNKKGDKFKLELTGESCNPPNQADTDRVIMEEPSLKNTTSNFEKSLTEDPKLSQSLHKMSEDREIANQIAQRDILQMTSLSNDQSKKKLQQAHDDGQIHDISAGIEQQKKFSLSQISSSDRLQIFCKILEEKIQLVYRMERRFYWEDFFESAKAVCEKRRLRQNEQRQAHFILKSIGELLVDNMKKKVIFFFLDMKLNLVIDRFCACTIEMIARLKCRRFFLNLKQISDQQYEDDKQFKQTKDESRMITQESRRLKADKIAIILKAVMHGKILSKLRLGFELIKYSAMHRFAVFAGLLSLNKTIARVEMRHAKTGEFESFFNLKIVFLLSKFTEKLQKYVTFGYLSYFRGKVEEQQISRLRQQSCQDQLLLSSDIEFTELPRYQSTKSSGSEVVKLAIATFRKDQSNEIDIFRVTKAQEASVNGELFDMQMQSEDHKHNYQNNALVPDYQKKLTRKNLDSESQRQAQDGRPVTDVFIQQIESFNRDILLNLVHSKHVQEKSQNEVERDTIEKYLEYFKGNQDQKEKVSMSKSKNSFVDLNKSKSGRNSKKTLDSIVFSEIQDWDQDQQFGITASEKFSMQPTEMSTQFMCSQAEEMLDNKTKESGIQSLCKDIQAGKISPNNAVSKISTSAIAKRSDQEQESQQATQALNLYPSEKSEHGESVVESEYLNRFENDPLLYGKFLLPVSGRGNGSQNVSEKKSLSVSDSKSTPSTNKPSENHVLVPNSKANFTQYAQEKTLTRTIKEARHNSLPNINQSEQAFQPKEVHPLNPQAESNHYMYAENYGIQKNSMPTRNLTDIIEEESARERESKNSANLNKSNYILVEKSVIDEKGQEPLLCEQKVRKKTIEVRDSQPEFFVPLTKTELMKRKLQTLIPANYKPDFNFEPMSFNVANTSLGVAQYETIQSQETKATQPKLKVENHTISPKNFDGYITEDRSSFKSRSQAASSSSTRNYLSEKIAENLCQIGVLVDDTSSKNEDSKNFATHSRSKKKRVRDSVYDKFHSSSEKTVQRKSNKNSESGHHLQQGDQDHTQNSSGKMSSHGSRKKKNFLQKTERIQGTLANHIDCHDRANINLSSYLRKDKSDQTNTEYSRKNIATQFLLTKRDLRKSRSKSQSKNQSFINIDETGQIMSPLNDRSMQGIFNSILLSETQKVAISDQNRVEKGTAAKHPEELNYDSRPLNSSFNTTKQISELSGNLDKVKYIKINLDTEQEQRRETASGKSSSQVLKNPETKREIDESIFIDRKSSQILEKSHKAFTRLQKRINENRDQFLHNQVEKAHEVRNNFASELHQSDSSKPFINEGYPNPTWKYENKSASLEAVRYSQELSAHNSNKKDKIYTLSQQIPRNHESNLSESGSKQKGYINDKKIAGKPPLALTKTQLGFKDFFTAVTLKNNRIAGLATQKNKSLKSIGERYVKAYSQTEHSETESMPRNRKHIDGTKLASTQELDKSHDLTPKKIGRARGSPGGASQRLKNVVQQSKHRSFSNVEQGDTNQVKKFYYSKTLRNSEDKSSFSQHSHEVSKQHKSAYEQAIDDQHGRSTRKLQDKAQYFKRSIEEYKNSEFDDNDRFLYEPKHTFSNRSSQSNGSNRRHLIDNENQGYKNRYEEVKHKNILGGYALKAEAKRNYNSSLLKKA